MKKAFVLGAGLGLLLVLLFGRSHVGTAMRLVKSNVRENVPVQWEINHAREMIRNLDPEIRNNMHLVAREEVEVSRLRDQLDGAQHELARSQRDILRLKGDLDEGQTYYVYAGREYSAREVRTDLERRWEKYRTQEATVERLKQILDARAAGLRAAQEKLAAMVAAKEQLEVEVENLEARMKLVEVAQTTSRLNVDDSHLSKTRDLLDQIATRIDVAERLVHANTPVIGQIPLDEDETRDVLDEIAEHFGARQQDENLVKLDR